MARILPRSCLTIRHLLLTLIAIGLVMRVGSACEAMAAIPAEPAAHHADCADMPVKADKATKSDVTACALCMALPGSVSETIGTSLLPALEPAAGLSDIFAGLASGPAPPPPKMA